MLGSSLLSPLSDYGYLRIPRFTSNGIRRASRFPYLAWLHVRCSSHGLFRCSSGELRALNLTTTLNIFILMMMILFSSSFLFRILFTKPTLAGTSPQGALMPMVTQLRQLLVFGCKCLPTFSSLSARFSPRLQGTVYQISCFSRSFSR